MIFFLCVVKVCTGAHYLCTDTDSLFGSNTHYLGYLRYHCISGNGTCVYLGLSLYDRLCTGLATGVSATAAVGAGQDLGYLLYSLIHLNGKLCSGKGEGKAQNTADNSKTQGGDNYFLDKFHLFLPPTC